MSDKQIILNRVQSIDDTKSYEEILYHLYMQLDYADIFRYND